MPGGLSDLMHKNDYSLDLKNNWDLEAYRKSKKTDFSFQNNLSKTPINFKLIFFRYQILPCEMQASNHQRQRYHDKKQWQK